MSDFKYKKNGETIRVGDEVTVPSIDIRTKFVVNGYVVDETLRPKHQIDLISQPNGGDPVQLRVNMELIENTGNSYNLDNL